MRVSLKPLSVVDKVFNATQGVVHLRIKGHLHSFAKADLNDEAVLNEIQHIVQVDCDALEELVVNGTVRRLQRAVMNGNETAADVLVSFGSLEHVSGSNLPLFDDETRPRPYWIHFGDEGSLLLRYMRPNQRGKGQRPNFEVGFTLWGASLALSRLVIEGMFPQLKPGTRVLELGSGLGLCGLAVAKFAKCQVILSDFHPDVVHNCKMNIRLNDLGQTCQAQLLDWEDFSNEAQDLERVTVIIGSDVVCQPKDCVSIANVLDAFLAPEGTALFCLGSTDSRYGVDSFEEVLKSRGYYVNLLRTFPGELDSWVSTSSSTLDQLVGAARAFSLYQVSSSRSVSCEPQSH